MQMTRHPADRLPRNWAEMVASRFDVLAEAEGACWGLEAEPVNAAGDYRRYGEDARFWLFGPDSKRPIGEAAALTEVARVAADLAGPEALRADARDGLLAAVLLARAFAWALPAGPARAEAERALRDVLAAASAAAVEG